MFYDPDNGWKHTGNLISFSDGYDVVFPSGNTLPKSGISVVIGDVIPPPETIHAQKHGWNKTNTKFVGVISPLDNVFRRFLTKLKLFMKYYLKLRYHLYKLVLISVFKFVNL